MVETLGDGDAGIVKTIGDGHTPGMSWEHLFWLTVLGCTVVGLIVFTIFVLNFPNPYNPYRADLIEEDNFSEEDKKKKKESGYGYFANHRGTNKTLKVEASVTVLVLGDIGRSPRMQYHVASIAKHGGKVSLVGYVESEIIPEVANNRFVRIIPLKPIPESLRTSSTLLFPFVAPLKVIWQLWSVWVACGYRTKATKWMLVQNPPSIPTLLIAQFVCFVRNTRLIIDWHNFGYTILALKLGQNHPLVKLSKWYEQYVARWANAHFCVTNAMGRVLKQQYGVEALTLHDRPAEQFQPLTPAQRSEVLHRLEGTKAHAKRIENKEWRLLVSSTSWTVDEDFSLLLDALIAYSATVSMDKRYPKILAIITGKGPQKEYYLNQIKKLTEQKRLSNVIIETAWLSLPDYASLLGAADIGVSLHKSSSGVDLPMKVVDMFGAGLPVFGYSKFEAWKELVQDGVNGMGFESGEELETFLEKAFTGNGNRLEKLRVGAEKETKRRWDDEWFPVAGRLLGLDGNTVNTEPLSSTTEKPTTSTKDLEAPVEKTTESFIGPARPEEPTEPIAGPVREESPVETLHREEPLVEEVIVQPAPAPVETAPELKVEPSPAVLEAAQHTHDTFEPKTESPVLVEAEQNRSTLDTYEPQTRGIDESWQDVSASSIEEIPEEKRGGTWLNYRAMQPEGS